LIVVAHMLRIIVEGPAPAKDPVFVFFTLAAASLAVWSLRVFRALPRA
jgi:hypothetical protein